MFKKSYLDGKMLNIRVLKILLASAALFASSLFAQYNYQWIVLQDTIYVLGDVYMIVSLQEQMLWVHYRNGEILEIPISSGTKKILDGEETPPGIYTIQTKATMAISRQFDSTRMLWWMGFSGNFGFHALEGNSYYTYLGKRPSSHGCIRLSREDAERIYPTVPLGTPVMIYDLPPARTLAFAPPSFDTTQAIALRQFTPQLTAHLEERLCRLYAGEYLLANFPPLYIDGKTVLFGGAIDPGEFYRIPYQQRQPYRLIPLSAPHQQSPSTRTPLFSITKPYMPED